MSEAAIRLTSLDRRTCCTFTTLKVKVRNDGSIEFVPDGRFRPMWVLFTHLNLFELVGSSFSWLLQPPHTEAINIIGSPSRPGPASLSAIMTTQWGKSIGTTCEQPPGFLPHSELQTYLNGWAVPLGWDRNAGLGRFRGVALGSANTGRPAGLPS